MSQNDRKLKLTPSGVTIDGFRATGTTDWRGIAKRNNRYPRTLPKYDPCRYIEDFSYRIQIEHLGEEQTLGVIEYKVVDVREAKACRASMRAVFDTFKQISPFLPLQRKLRDIERMVVIHTVIPTDKTLTQDEIKLAINLVIEKHKHGKTVLAMCTYIPNTFPHMSTEDEKAEFMQNIGFKYYKDPGLIAGQVFWKQAE